METNQMFPNRELNNNEYNIVTIQNGNIECILMQKDTEIIFQV